MLDVETLARIASTWDGEIIKAFVKKGQWIW